MTRYIAITPARDEEKLLPGLIASMAAQNWTPDRWIVIDDGSADATAEILEEAARTYPWIEPHHLPRDRPRAPGGECVITQFLPHEACQEYDYVLRLDADVSFESGFIDLLLEEFARDPKLGIASPTLWEPKGSEWVEIRQPEYHTRGPAKMYSLACFNAIGELDPDSGGTHWTKRARCCTAFTPAASAISRARHHRPQGSRVGMEGADAGRARGIQCRLFSAVYDWRARRVQTFDAPAADLRVSLLLAGYLSMATCGASGAAQNLNCKFHPPASASQAAVAWSPMALTASVGRHASPAQSLRRALADLAAQRRFFFLETAAGLEPRSILRSKSPKIIAAALSFRKIPRTRRSPAADRDAGLLSVKNLIPAAVAASAQLARDQDAGASVNSRDGPAKAR